MNETDDARTALLHTMRARVFDMLPKAIQNVVRQAPTSHIAKGLDRLASNQASKADRRAAEDRDG